MAVPMLSRPYRITYSAINLVFDGSAPLWPVYCPSSTLVAGLLISVTFTPPVRTACLAPDWQLYMLVGSLPDLPIGTTGSSKWRGQVS